MKYKRFPTGGGTGDSVGLPEKSLEVYKQGLVEDLVQGNM